MYYVYTEPFILQITRRVFDLVDIPLILCWYSFIWLH